VSALRGWSSIPQNYHDTHLHCDGSNNGVNDSTEQSGSTPECSASVRKSHNTMWCIQQYLYYEFPPAGHCPPPVLIAHRGIEALTESESRSGYLYFVALLLVDLQCLGFEPAHRRANNSNRVEHGAWPRERRETSIHCRPATDRLHRQLGNFFFFFFFLGFITKKNHKKQ
jgi:hypothetical protein